MREEKCENPNRQQTAMVVCKINTCQIIIGLLDYFSYGLFWENVEAERWRSVCETPNKVDQSAKKSIVIFPLLKLVDAMIITIIMSAQQKGPLNWVDLIGF